MKALFRRLIGILFAVGMLFSLTACAPPLYNEEEILEILTKRYESEFVIVETLEDELMCPTWVDKCKAYAAAPKDDPTNVFYVRQIIFGVSDIFRSHGNVVEDTRTSDYYIKQFHEFLQENNIRFLFETNDIATDVSEYLSKPHTQGGKFFICITEDTAEDVVNQVFDFTESLDMECFYDETKDMYIGVYFFDEPKFMVYDEVDQVEMPHFWPYNEMTGDQDRESLLAEIRETFYKVA